MDASLRTSSYIVLGLLAQRGAGTSYDLKRWANESVGYFWNFPHSQLYAEPQRLVSLGLLNERQEQTGRRKRVFELTPAGHTHLQQWLSEPAGVPELRDLGLLKLFFIGPEDNAQLKKLAAEQLELHQQRLMEYRRIEEALTSHVPRLSEHPLTMGLKYERASIAFWSELIKEDNPT